MLDLNQTTMFRCEVQMEADAFHSMHSPSCDGVPSALLRSASRHATMLQRGMTALQSHIAAFRACVTVLLTLILGLSAVPASVAQLGGAPSGMSCCNRSKKACCCRKSEVGKVALKASPQCGNSCGQTSGSPVTALIRVAAVDLSYPPFSHANAAFYQSAFPSAQTDLAGLQRPPPPSI